MIVHPVAFGYTPMTMLGDIIYGADDGVITRLAGNIIATKKFLTQTGTGSVSAAPAWNVISASDLPVLPLSIGGLGAVLSDPNANKLLGWDDTDNASCFIAIGANLSYDNATHTLSASGGASGATTALDNLASVAINTALIPASAAGLDFGSATKPWKDLWLAGSSGTPGTNNFKITGASTSGTRTWTLPDASDTFVGLTATQTLTNKTLTSPIMTAPTLGTPASGVATNLTGTASGLTAGNVTTNANLTGPIISSGNATSIASQTGTGTIFVMSAAPVIAGGSHTALTALGIRSTSAAFDLMLASSEVLTAGRTLSIVLGDAARTLTLTAAASIGGTHSGTSSGSNTGDQTITLTGGVTGSGVGSFAATVVTNANLTGDVTSSGNATTLANIPTATPAVGTILHTNIAAPSSPAAGKVSVYSDSTDLRFHDKNASGVIGTTVVADAGASNNFLTAISAAGVISKAQPAFSNLSGSIAASQMPALTGDVTTSAGAVATTIAANAVTLAKMAQVVTASILGRNTAATGNVEVLTTLPTGVMPAFAGGDVTSSAGSLTLTIGATRVTNAMLTGSIAYSKLSLTGAILNADLAGSIAYSKLALTGAILNADLVGSIAYSKLSLTGAILNADLAGSIAATKLLVNADFSFTATQTITKSGIAATSTDGAILTNTTAAAVNAQQWSPRLRLTGQGWKTTATAASQTVDWIIENQPVQGTANPTTNLVISSQVNATGFVAQATLTSAGILTATGFIGALTGNVTGNVTGSSGTCAGLAGSATVLATARAIYGNNFDGSVALAQIISSVYGGTGNGFTKFSGPTSSEKTFTLPNASAMILTDNAAVTVAQGGTGQTSYAVGDLLYASGATALSKLADVTAGSYLRSGGVTTAPVWSTLILPNATTAGSVVYGSAANTYGQDNANFFWDGTNHRLGVGNAAPQRPLQVTVDGTAYAARFGDAANTNYLDFQIGGAQTLIKSTGARKFIFENNAIQQFYLDTDGTPIFDASAGSLYPFKAIVNTAGIGLYVGDATGTNYLTFVSGGAESRFQASANRPLKFNTNGATGLTISGAQLIQFPAYGVGTLTSDASGNITAVSDERIKRNIQPFTRGLDALLGINPIFYGYTLESGLDQTRDDYAGFSAQNILRYIPEAIGYSTDGMMSLSDRPIIAALVNACNQLRKRVEELEKELCVY